MKYSFIDLKPFLINDLELNLLEKTLLSGHRIQKLEETSALAKGSDFHRRLSGHMVRNKTYYSPKSQMCHRFWKVSQYVNSFRLGLCVLTFLQILSYFFSIEKPTQKSSSPYLKHVKTHKYWISNSEFVSIF